MRDPLERFAEKVEFGDCWLWTGATHRKGYGQFRAEGSMKQAHRWLWEHVVGPIPDGLELDHLCKVRNCVNPDHLEPVTHEENVRRASPNTAAMRARWANWQAARPSCPKGHPFSDENTRWRGNTRICRECNRQRSKAWREENRERYRELQHKNYLRRRDAAN